MESITILLIALHFLVYNVLEEGYIMMKIFNTNMKNLELNQITSIRKGCWIDLIKPNDQDIKLLTESLKVDTSFISYILDDEEQPRIDMDLENQIKMIFVDVPIKEKKQVISTIPLAILFIQDDYIVTISLEENEVLKDFKMGKVKEFFTQKKSRFSIQILYRTATLYLRYLKNINREIERVEKKMLKATNNRDLINLLSIEKSLVYITTSLKSNEIVLEKILKGNIIDFYEEDMELLEDAIIENKQCIEMANLYREILGSMTDSFATIISNNLNNMMKFLAGITIVFSIPTMVASFMGMNVPLGSFGEFPYAFFILVMVSVILSLLVAWLLKKKNML